jgi:hypothetical protein
MREFKTEVGIVLAEFFKKVDGGWVNERCEAEIERYHQLAERNRENGRRGGRPRKPTVNPDETQRVPEKNPPATQKEPDGKLTKNHEPGTSTRNQIPLSPSGPEKERTLSFCTGRQKDDRSAASGPAGPSGTAGPAEVYLALKQSGYRRNAANREHALIEAADRLHAAGIGSGDLLTLAQRAERRGKKPIGLFATWVDNIGEALKELGKR